MKAGSKVFGILVTLAALAVLFQWRATQNYLRQNYSSSNFFVFWLSGKLVLAGENPYSAEDWANGHDVYASIAPKEPTFLYPLPLAVLLTPLGLLPLGQAYFFWQWIGQVAIAIVVYFLLNHWGSSAHTRLFVPIMLFLSYFGPTYLTLQIGALGPLTLFFIFSAMYLLDKDHLFLAGVLLSLTMLKPSQGVTLLLLLGLVFLLKRQWNVILGITAGGLLLLLLGFAIDMDWVSIFRHSSEAAFDRRLGMQSNIWSFSHLSCNGNTLCDSILGSVGMLLLLGGSAYFLWRNHMQMTYWQIFNLIIPVAFVSTIYLWAYDQILYILPILWIVGTLVEKNRSYVFAFLFLILLDLLSLFALAQQAVTQKDLWSLGTTLLVLTFLFIAQRQKQKPVINKQPV